MKSFEYGDEEISHREILFAVTSMIIGIGIITLPRSLASVTQGSDGWVSILLGGGISLIFVWIVAKLASRFPKQTFLEYTTRLVTKPIAVILTLLVAFHLMQFTAYEMRAVANISKVFLFDRTPVEVVALVFLLVVIYGVSGSRAGLLRLNLLFIPIILFIGFALIIMNLGLFEYSNLKPFFTTEFTAYFKGAQETTFTFLGFEILLFYIALMNRPEKAPRAAVIGMTIPIVFYLFTFLIAVGVFGHTATINIVDPVIELAKEVQVPGEFFERFESLFFTIWVMTLFNTAAMAFDVALIAVTSVFPKFKKITLIFIFAPIIYLSGMFPPNLVAVFEVGKWLSYSGIFFAMIIPAMLLAIAKLRGIKGYG